MIAREGSNSISLKGIEPTLVLLSTQAANLNRDVNLIPSDNLPYLPLSQGSNLIPKSSNIPSARAKRAFGNKPVEHMPSAQDVRMRVGGKQVRALGPRRDRTGKDKKDAIRQKCN